MELIIAFIMLAVILPWMNFYASRKKGWLLKLALALADAVMIGIPLMLLIALEGLNPYRNLVWIGMGALLELTLVGWMLNWWNKKRLVCILLGFALLAGADRWFAAYRRHLQEISIPESFDYRDYLPYKEGSPVKTLDEPSQLHLTKNLPEMDGATALYPVYAAFAQAAYPKSAFMGEHGRITGPVYCSTTEMAYSSLIHGEADVIFVAGPSQAQEEMAREKGVELVYTPIGREAFVFFVNPENPIDGLTLDEIRGIYSGKTTKWDQLGVKGLGDIRAFQRREGSGSQTALERFVMRDTPLMEAPKENVYGDMVGIVEAAASYKNFKNAIGYSFRFYCTELMKGFDVKLLKIDGVAPTLENIENGTYPLASSFYAVTRSDASENTRALVDWICGPQGQELIQKTGYTPISN